MTLSFFISTSDVVKQDRFLELIFPQIALFYFYLKEKLSPVTSTLILDKTMSNGRMDVGRSYMSQKAFIHERWISNRNKNRNKISYILLLS